MYIIHIYMLYAIVDAYLLCNLKTQILHTRQLAELSYFRDVTAFALKFHGIFGPQVEADSVAEWDTDIGTPWENGGFNGKTIGKP